MSGENLDFVRAIYAEWERGEFAGSDWASRELVFGFADGPDRQTVTGVEAAVAAWRAFERSWESLRFEGVDYRELDAEHVLVTNRFVGRAKGSELELSQVPSLQATLLEIRDGKVTRLMLYWRAEQALADLGLEA
jgi:hypothetical protein